MHNKLGMRTPTPSRERNAICKVARTACLGILVSVGLVGPALGGQEKSTADRPDNITWAVQIAQHYPLVLTNITYYTVGNYDVKLDVIMHHGSKKLRPTIVNIHGGGWAGGWTKDGGYFGLLPFLQLGWNVVNVDYRASTIAPAPAAVEDCLCALRWVELNAKRLNIDVDQVVIMGGSAGGHLALMTGMVERSSSGLGRPCQLTKYSHPLSGLLGVEEAGFDEPTHPLRPAAIINWMGITDVADLLEGPNRRDFAVIWLGNRPDRATIAAEVSPLSYVREDLPPIITIHGDADKVVPYNHAIRLHDALTRARVTNKLITIHGRGHEWLGVDATRDAYIKIFDFLEKVGVNVNPS